MKLRTGRRVSPVLWVGVFALVLAAPSYAFACWWGQPPPPVLVSKSGVNFTISSTIFETPSGSYPAARCSGTPALLYPGVTRCLVYTVTNHLSVPITVQTITTALDSSYPAPPTVCSGAYLTLPSFSGSLPVAAGASAQSPGVPIELKDSGTNQDACENFTYHFVYTGNARYTDTTTTVLASWPNPSISGEPVTFVATVKATDAATDPSGPTGTVDFYRCATSSCTSTELLGSSTVGFDGQATFSTKALPVGTSYVQAVYEGVSTTFTSSTSNVVAQVVVAIPPRCQPKHFDDFFYFFGSPQHQWITGTDRDDFIYAVGGDYVVNDGNGDDCICLGDQDNFVTAGNGSDDVFAGNGSNQVNLGSGTDSVTVGNGDDNRITLGGGPDEVSLGTGSHDYVSLGGGTDTVTIQSPGANDTIYGGAGDETIFLGSGTDNTYDGQAHHTNFCHLPTPPSSWHGTTAAYYHDTLQNCTVVSP